MEHSDFRVGGKIFATLGYPEEGWGMVKLPPPQEERFVQAEASVFVPVTGAWTRRGSTKVFLKAASARKLKPDLDAAWRNTAPNALIKNLELSTSKT